MDGRDGVELGLEYKERNRSGDGSELRRVVRDFF